MGQCGDADYLWDSAEMQIIFGTGAEMQIIFRTVRRFRLSLRPFGDLDSLWDSLKIHKSIEHCGDSDSLWDSVIIQIIFKRV